MTASFLFPQRRSFGVMRESQYRLYWSANLLSDTAQWTQLALYAWIIFQFTDSPVFVAVYTVCRFLPKFVVSPIAGVLADRVNRLSLLRVSQFTTFALSLALALAFSLGVYNEWLLLGISGLIGANFAFDQPARRSLLPAIVGRRDLLCAVSLDNSAFNLAVILGPISAAFLLGTGGTAAALYAVAVLYAAAIVALLFMQSISQVSKVIQNASVGTHILDAFKYLRKTPKVSWLLLVSFLPGFSDRFFVLFLPLLTNEALGITNASDDQMALIRGLGAISGGVMLATWGQLDFRGIITPLALACAAASALFILTPWVALSLAILGAAGLLRAVLSSTATTMLHTSIPDGLRGRMMSI